jgi:hypothetical protein
LEVLAAIAIEVKATTTSNGKGSSGARSLVPAKVNIIG